MTLEFAQKATQGAGWNYLSFGLSKILSLAIVSTLAHLLSPEVFGVVALATLAIEYLSVFNDFGLGAALIQRRDDIEITSNIVFSLNILIGITLTLATFLLAPLAAKFFGESDLTSVLRWLGLTFFLNAIGSVHRARLQRDLNFRLKLLPELGNVISKGIVSIGFAFAGFGVWSLVFGQLIGATISAILLWVVVPWRPAPGININAAKELLKFGLPVMGENGISVFGDSFDYFLIGLFYNSESLGIYTLAYRLPEMLVINMLWVLAAVIFPAFSSVQTQKTQLKSSFLATTKFVQLLVTPICVGMFVAADPIIRVAFGEQWLSAIPIMKILSVYALIFSIGFHVGDVFKAIGRPDILIKLSFPIFIIRIIAIWIGAQYSLLGVAIGHLIVGVIELCLRTVITVKVVGVSLREILSQLSAFWGGLVILLIALPLLKFVASYASILQLAIVVPASAIGYTGIIWFLEQKSLKKLYATLRKQPNNS